MGKVFDPFSSTLEEAQALEKELLAGTGKDILIGGPVWGWGGAQQLVGRKAFYEKNPLDGMAVCAGHDLVAPDWLARAYLKGFHAVANSRVGSWDEAFGPPVPKGKQLAAMRRDRGRREQVWKLVIDYVKQFPGEPMERLWDAFDAKLNDEDLDVKPKFAERVREMGLGSTKAQELYAEACRYWGFGADEVRKSQGWLPIVPAKFRKVAGMKK